MLLLERQMNYMPLNLKKDKCYVYIYSIYIYNHYPTSKCVHYDCNINYVDKYITNYFHKYINHFFLNYSTTCPLH